MPVILFNKPFGVLSQFTPEGNHPALNSFGFPKNIYAAGRLDHDSEGALLLTDDGKLIKQLLDPEMHHPRTYLTRPCTAKAVPHPDWLWERNPPIRERKNIPTSWVEITLTEGKNRQVRHMTAAVGFPTLRLIRIRIGKLSLDGLPPGKWREVEEKIF